MWKSLKKWWRYMGAKLSSDFEAHADPKVQLEQAIADAHEQHRLLREQAANVVANQKQNEMRLHAALEELDKLERNAQQAVLMADESARTGDNTKAAEYVSAAEAFANQLIATESRAADLKLMVAQSTQAAEQAKAAVAQNSRLLRQKLDEQRSLLSQLDQAKMAEQMNAAMSTLSDTSESDVPSLAEVRDKIEGRYAKAVGMSELHDLTVDSKMLEVEQAATNMAAHARLSEIRSRLGITDAGETQPAETAEGEAPGETAPS